MKKGITCRPVLLAIIFVLLSSYPCGADTNEDTVPINEYVVGNYFWTHHIPAGFTAETAEIELYISFWTFNDYGVTDLFCSNNI